MRKKIALYVNGWNNEITQRTIRGIRRYDKDSCLDLFVLNCFASYNTQEDESRGALSVYALPYMEDFDGLIIFSNSLAHGEVARELGRQAAEKQIPAVSIGVKMDGLSYVGVDDRIGMRELITHLVEEHGVKRIAFIGGTPEHVDSNERLQVTRDVLAKHGLDLAEEDIYYGYWSYFGVLNVILQILDRKTGLPDAIVCANDTMALAAISELTLRGYEVPRDVLVTGFDGMERGKQFYPSLSTVEQDLERVGEMCCKILLENTGEVVSVNAASRAIFAESCGCFQNGRFEELRHEFCHKSYSNSLRGELITQTERAVENAILGAVDADTLRDSLKYQFSQDRVIEGNDFYMVLDPCFFRNIMEDYRKVLVEEISEEMSVFVAKRDGQLLEGEKVNRHELIPGYESATGPHTYYINALHLECYNIGYLVFVDEPFLVKDNVQASYVNRVRQALHALRINMRLDALNKNLMALYNRDAMTGLYNRFGYENLAIPMFEQCRFLKEKMMVCFLDINYMKRINDVYGHLQGDIAIVIVANAIKRNERNRWIAIRYGGDEFLVIAACKGKTDAENIKKNILRTVDEIAKERDLPYHPSVSCGYVITEPESSLSLQDYIKAADDVMYEIKRSVHAGD